MSKLKATRRLFNFDFNQLGAHVALVHKDQGGPANGITTLITKATNTLLDVDKLDEVELEKALDQVTVKLSLEEFLRKFFDMYHSDAELLTKIMGFETEYEASMDGDSPTSHKEFLEGKVSSITLMKSLSEGSIDKISKSHYLEILENQFLFETNEESLGMMVKKSLLDEAEGLVANLTKSLATTQADLTKALEKVTEFEKSAKNTLVQKRRDALSDVLASESVEATLNSLSALDDASFDLVVKQFKNKVEQEDTSDLFVEKGVGADLPEPSEEVDNTLLELIRKSKKA